MMEEKTEKKFLGMAAGMAAVVGLFLTFWVVIIVLATFAFFTIRADYARIEASIAASRAEWKADIADLSAERKAGIAALCAEWKADIADLSAERKAGIAALRADMDEISDKIDRLEASLDVRLDEIEREQARLQGAVEVLRGRQAQNP